MPLNCSKNASIPGMGGWLLSVPPPLLSPPQKAKGVRATTTTLQSTNHPKTNSKPKVKVKVKVKIKVKT
jgi:hypothetical protein